MTKSGKKLGQMISLLFLVLALVATSCVPAGPAPGEKIVKVGTVCHLTGLIATSLVPATYATIDYAKLLNEQGGIDGIKVKVLWEDTAGSVPKVVTAHKRLRESGVVLEFHQYSSQIEAIATTLQRDRMPGIWGAGATPGMTTRPERWFWSGTPGWAAESAIIMKWIKDNWKEARPPRVAIMHSDSASGWGVYEGKAAAPELGLEFVGSEVIAPIAVIDTSVEWLRLAGKKPDWIIVYHYGSNLTVLIKDAARLGIQEKGIRLVNLQTIDEVMPVVGTDAEGWFFEHSWPVAEDEHLPDVQTVLQAAKRYRGYEPHQVPYLYFMMWITHQIGVEGALKPAIKEVGVENLTGAVIRDRLAAIKDLKIGFGLPPITFIDKPPVFNTRGRVAQVKQGKLVMVSDWMEASWYPAWAKE